MSIKPTPARCLQRRSFEQGAREGTKIIKETDPSHKSRHLYTINNPLHSYLKTYPKPISTETSNPIMQLQTLLSGVVPLMMAVSPALALPEAIPEAIPELYDRAQCIGGKHLVGSGCGPAQKGKTSCSANDRAVVSPLPSANRPTSSTSTQYPLCRTLRVPKLAMADRGLPIRRSSAPAQAQSGKCRTAVRGALAATTASVARRLHRPGGRKAVFGSISARMDLISGLTSSPVSGGFASLT
ncbi:MAG: hypothetical protein L6R42_009431 [Xanthoria sp. 1 TBL-2021]|nr:MAG: hypothetical protein L6R42_009431 [Xanthoria sp. 1 TBL-2021]